MAHPATRELGNTVFDSRGRYTQHKRQACHSGGREGGAQWGGQPALPAPPAPGPLTPTHCLCGPQHKTSVNTRLLPALNRLTWRPGSPPQPSWPTTPRPLQKHEARPRLQPAPRSGCFPAGNVLSTEPARGAETPQGSAPPSFVLSQNELVPCCYDFLHVCGVPGTGEGRQFALGVEVDFICGQVCLSPRLRSGGLEYPPSPPDAHLPRCQAPGRQDSGRALLSRAVMALAGETRGHARSGQWPGGQ